MEVKEAIKIAQTIVNNHNAMTGLINYDVEAIQTLIDHATHPQREALDEEKVRKIIDKIAIVVDGEIKFLPLTTIYEITKEICSLSLPSLSDLLSALPEKIDNITPTLMNANHVCDCYNMAIDACIAALTKRMEELNEKN